jgi:DNA-binding beta-propeller fold protein YncE
MDAGRGGGAAIVAVMLFALGGCATTPPPEEIHLVWPAPPQTTRIKFLRSVYSDQNFHRELTAKEQVLNFLGGEKPPPNRIVEPIGIAVSDNGNRLYVSDYGQSAVFEFDFAEKTVTRIGEGGALAQPNGLALDSTGNLYVVETAKKGISVFDPTGKPLRFITDSSVDRPTGIAIDRARGKIFLADTGHSKSKAHLVKVFDLEGERIATIGHGKGGGEGQFLFPTYLAVDKAGHLYVTDTLNARVQEFDADGKYLRRFGERGSGWGMFDKPKGIALDSFGNLYVVDSGWSNVQIFNPKGQILLFFGGRGPISGMLRNPTGIAIDKEDRIYVGDYINHRVEVYQLVNTTAADSFLSPPAAPGEKGDSKPVVPATPKLQGR